MVRLKIEGMWIWNTLQKKSSFPRMKSTFFFLFNDDMSVKIIPSSKIQQVRFNRSQLTLGFIQRKRGDAKKMGGA